MPNVLVTELMWPEGLSVLEDYGTVAYDPGLWERPEELGAAVGAADALIVRNQTRVDASLLERGASLKAVGRLGVGLDNIDLAAAKTRKIPVVYARNANAVSVAEYVMAAMLHCSRGLSAADQSVRDGRWDRRRFTGAELYGKCLGLVGVGEIAQRVAKRAEAFAVRVIGHDPFVAPYDYPATELKVEMTDLDALLAAADFVSVHVPLNESTHHLLSLSAFGKMKPGAWIINTARGGVVNEADLAVALEQELVGGAVLDVLEEEPLSSANPLLDHDCVVLTPHVAGLTEESQIRTSRLVAEEVVKILQGRPSLCVAR